MGELHGDLFLEVTPKQLLWEDIHIQLEIRTKIFRTPQKCTGNTALSERRLATLIFT